MNMRGTRIGAVAAVGAAVLASVVATVVTRVLAAELVADANCTCRGLGRNFELGETACLETPKGPRIATCGMNLNNTSWLFSDTPCPAARGLPAVPEKQAKSEAGPARVP
jgi:hypothetical protein